MPDAILALNAGSSSIKFALYWSESSGLRLRMRGEVEDMHEGGRLWVHDPDGRSISNEEVLRGPEAFRHALDWIRAHLAQDCLVAVGHRIVHGGAEFFSPRRLNRALIQRLAALTPLAPLHQKRCLEPFEEVLAFWPNVPQFGVFDTAFHRTIAPPASRFAIPRVYEEMGVRKYGFHGLSYEYVAGETATRLGLSADARVIVAHLGNGASLCGMQGGMSVDTTMGMTTLDGLVMGTRCGALDPGVVLYLQQACGKTAEQVQQILYDQSGLLGVSGLSSDMRTLLASDDPHAIEAVELFVYRVARESAAMASSLGGLDAFIFTGGIGANSPQIRSMTCKCLAWLGLELDEKANLRSGACISTKESKIDVYALRTDEEAIIARHTLPTLGGEGSSR